MAKSKELDDISIVKIKGVGTALKGVYRIFERAKKKGFKDEELIDFLIDEMKWLNTISKADEKRLREALPKKFEKFLKGLPEDEENKKIVDIKILGRFTPNFFELEKQAMAAVIEMDVEGPFLQVKDPEQLAEYGAIPHPALVINGKIVSSGRVVMKDEIKNMIMEAIQKSGNKTNSEE